MKAGVLAIAAAIAVGVNASGNHAHQHAHKALHMERNYNATANGTDCGCTTIYSTWYGEATLHNPPPPSTSSSTSTYVAPPPSTTVASPPPPPSTTATPTTTPAPVVPTPYVATCPTPGVYTFPATTLTLTETTTVCGATSTSVPPGTHTAGGVTTVVETSTTIVCPYATTVSPSGGVVTSTILTTTYVCPSAGTYTIAPLTTTVSKSTVWVYPTPATYPAGTYTQSEVVTTVTETDYVFFCPFTSPAPVSAAPTYAPAPVVSYSAVPTYSAAPSPSASSAPVTGGELGSSGNKWASTYTPYTEAGLCKAAGDVATDIAAIKAAGFTVLRVYSTDCNALENIGGAVSAAGGMKLILGAFISADTGIGGAQEQISDLTAWAKWDLVELIILGNEAVHSNTCSASDLAGFISSATSALKGAGYSGPVSTAEPLDVWQENADVFCSVVDVVAVNIHAFFNPNTVAKDAGKFVKSQLEIADGLCDGKYAINSESGWPSAGTGCNGIACPGEQEQADAIASITTEVGGKTVMFSPYNDNWKDPGAFGCERSWGVLHLFQ